MLLFVVVVMHMFIIRIDSHVVSKQSEAEEIDSNPLFGVSISTMLKNDGADANGIPLLVSQVS